MSEITKSHCNTCDGQRNHFIKAFHVDNGEETLDELNSIWWRETWQILQCCGCEHFSARKTFTFSEWEPGEQEVKVYPPAISKRKPKWFDKLEDITLNEIFSELYIVLEANAPMLAVSACRIIVDRIINMTVGDQGNFKAGLRKLVDDQQIAGKDRELVETVIDAGNASSHRGWSPKEAANLEAVVSIVENLVERIFILPKVSGELKAVIPPRKK